jgi:hypothetical protein
MPDDQTSMSQGAPTTEQSQPSSADRIVHYPAVNATVHFPGELSDDEFHNATHQVWQQLSEFGSGVSQALGGSGDLKQDVAGTVRGIEHPLDTLKQIASGIASVPSQQAAIFEKAKDAYDQGDYVSAAAHAVNYLLPFVGPANEQASQLLKQGKTSQALGMMAGTTATLLPGGGEEVVRPVTRTVESVPKVITELKPAFREAVTGEAGEATVPFTGKPGATEPANVPVFYSKAERIAQEKLPKSATGDQVLATLRNNGVKENEIQWMGLDDLEGKAKVSKEDLLQHINENKIELHEVDLGTPEQRQMQALSKQRQELYAENNRIWSDHLKYDPTDLSTELFNAIKQGSDLGINETINRMPDVMQGPARRFVETDRQLVDLDNQIAKLQYQIDRSGAKAPKYESYTLPGPKENYTEKLLTLPTKNADRIAELQAKMDEMAGRPSTEHAAHPEWKTQWDEWARELRSLTGARARMAQDNFTTSHFDEPNILAHTRYDDRIDAEGKRNLFVEEVQSDWAQKGKREGFRAETMKDMANKVDIAQDDYRAATTRWEALGDKTDRVSQEWKDLQEADRKLSEAQLNYNRAQNRVVPDMPFKSDWHELVAKRLLRKAAEEGYDRLSWTTGEQQAARYDLSKQIGMVEYYPETQTLEAYDHNGKKVMSEMDVDVKNLPDYIGKDATAKLKQKIDEYTPLREQDFSVVENDDDRGGFSVIDPNGEEVYHTSSPTEAQREVEYLAERDRAQYPTPRISGLDLKVGGEWAKNLYDSSIKNFMNKYGKRWGAKVGTTEIDTTPPGSLRYEIVDPQGNVQDAFRNRSGAEDAVTGYNEAHKGSGKWTVRDAGRTEKVWHIDITPAMRKSLTTEPQPIAEEKAPKFDWTKELVAG